MCDTNRKPNQLTICLITTRTIVVYYCYNNIFLAVSVFMYLKRDCTCSCILSDLLNIFNTVSNKENSWRTNKQMMYMYFGKYKIVKQYTFYCPLYFQCISISRKICVKFNINVKTSRLLSCKLFLFDQYYMLYIKYNFTSKILCNIEYKWESSYRYTQWYNIICPYTNLIYVLLMHAILNNVIIYAKCLAKYYLKYSLCNYGGPAKIHDISRYTGCYATKVLYVCLNIRNTSVSDNLNHIISWLVQIK